MKITIECEDDIEFVNIEFVRPGKNQSHSLRKGEVKAVSTVLQGLFEPHRHQIVPEESPMEPVAAYQPKGQKTVKDNYFESTEGEEGNQREAKIDEGMANFTV